MGHCHAVFTDAVKSLSAEAMIHRHRGDAALRNSYRVANERYFVLRNYFRFLCFPTRDAISDLNDACEVNHADCCGGLVNLCHPLLYFCCSHVVLSLSYFHYLHHDCEQLKLQLRQRREFKRTQVLWNWFAHEETMFLPEGDRFAFYNRINSRGANLFHANSGLRLLVSIPWVHALFLRLRVTAHKSHFWVQRSYFHWIVVAIHFSWLAPRWQLAHVRDLVPNQRFAIVAFRFHVQHFTAII